MPHKPKTADGDQLSVMDDAVKRSGGAGKYLVHAGILRCFNVPTHKKLGGFYV